MLLCADANPEVNVRFARDAVAALADTAERVTLVDTRALGHGDLAELQQRHGVAVAGTDRHRAAALRHAPDERHRPGCRRRNDATDVGADVDAAMLAACVRVAAERERAQDGAVHGPAPRTRARCGHEREQRHEREHTSHLHLHEFVATPQPP